VTQKVRIGLVQMRCGASPEENLHRAVERVEKAAEQGAKIICLPELFRSQYFCQTEDVDRFELAEPIPGPSTDRLSAVAAAREVVVVAPLFERRAPGVYHNSSVVIDADGSIVGRYRKMHIPDDPLFYEKFYFTPGDLGFSAVDTRYGRIGVLICWDQWYPEGARLTALRGAQILFYPTAIGWMSQEKEAVGEKQHSAWETIQRSHAIANGVFVAAVNRVGVEADLEFWGRSFVADPLGEVVAKADEEEVVALVDCDLGAIEETRRIWPFLRDRRVDAYQGLDRRWLD
jgi:N-carbamoylputrescine amidase